MNIIDKIRATHACSVWFILWKSPGGLIIFRETPYSHRHPHNVGGQSMHIVHRARILQVPTEWVKCNTRATWQIDCVRTSSSCAAFLLSIPCTERRGSQHSIRSPMKSKQIRTSFVRRCWLASTLSVRAVTLTHAIFYTYNNAVFASLHLYSLNMVHAAPAIVSSLLVNSSACNPVYARE